jgi:hypothetical protein
MREIYVIIGGIAAQKLKDKSLFKTGLKFFFEKG